MKKIISLFFYFFLVKISKLNGKKLHRGSFVAPREFPSFTRVLCGKVYIKFADKAPRNTNVLWSCVCTR